jgi:hypothetical protein
LNRAFSKTELFHQEDPTQTAKKCCLLRAKAGKAKAEREVLPDSPLKFEHWLPLSWEWTPW